jgi:Fe(3+) dicitrate transport protein
MTKRIISISIILFLALSQLLAQYTLTGRILLEEENTPIAASEIYHHSSQRIVLSEEDGSFIISNLSSGTHQFSVFSTDYSILTDTIVISENTTRDFYLTPLSFTLSSLELIAKKKELFGIKQLADIQGTSVYAGKKSEVILLDLVKGDVANNNSRQIYAQVAGLNIYEGSSGGLQLNIGGRGLDPNRTSNFNTRQNGYDISADVLGYPENYYTPPSESLSEIRILRGASSLQYGTQFGGLIDFRIRKIPVSRKLQLRSQQTYSSYNTFNSYNSIGLTENKLSVDGFYNYKSGDGYRDNSGYTVHNVFAAVRYRLSDKTQISAEYTFYDNLAKQAGGLTDAQFLEDPRQSTRTRNWFAVNWKLFNVQLSHQLNSSSELSLNLSRLDASRKTVGYRGNPITLNQNPITELDEQNSSGEYISARDLIDGRFKNYSAELKYLNRYQIKDKNSVFLIGSKYYKSNNTAIQGPGSRGTDADFNLIDEPDYPNQSDFSFPNTNLALFAENIIYLSDRLSLIPGLRLEHIRTEADGIYNQVVFDNAQNPIANILLTEEKNLPRNFLLAGLGLQYKKSPALNLVANISQNYRSITFSDIRIVSPTFIVDPDIRDEKGFTADIGMKGRLDKYLSYDLTAFSILYDDRIGIILNDRANRERKNIGRALISGTESLVIFNLSKFLNPDAIDFSSSFFVNSAFTYSRYLASSENNVQGRKVEFIPAVNLKAGVSIGYKSAELSYQYTYLSEQYTDAQNSEAAADGDSRSGTVGPIPSYSVSDLSLSYRFKKFTLKSGINNLLDRAYFTRRATGYPGPGIIPSDGRTFYFGVAWVFE